MVRVNVLAGIYAPEPAPVTIADRPWTEKDMLAESFDLIEGLEESCVFNVWQTHGFISPHQELSEPLSLH